MNLAELKAEASKCQFCGFCEFACPTYRSIRMMHFGPRGRVNLIRNFDGELSEAAYTGIMTCLGCRNCDIQCPAGIKIAEIIHEFKAYIINEKIYKNKK
ncbi:4Fe-4S ferredoxin, iron-sulfur binding domain protein [Thermoproteus uzoniensis 768-20]|uniref:4Fe-4S ferredoxin, iron-sulfur binding domain protein n=1 Tax=Thermoproteus uzoniensis (strain 768-20) TaxID=999630 RepID=F2L3M3_THEU7|nr:(Fe-S)-binding protein [Thermoproteus uzoniensis]AEA12007.1 4Fe-4S ferredoxin, iron-sulfur binding domain protein [Thermoproteus uzoniensis 768-20]